MKRRRGRRSFWWWSWLLLITAAGGTFGGAFFGKKVWEKAEKEYPSTAVVKVGIRPPFQGKQYDDVPTGVANVNEAAVMAKMESHDGLSAIAAELDLMQRWGLGLDEVIAALRSSLDLDLNQKENELNVTVVRPNPEEAAELANVIAKKFPEIIKEFDKTNKAEGLERLKLEAAPYAEAEEEARLMVKKALADIKVKLDPRPGVDLGIYMSVPAVLDAKLGWESASEARVAFLKGQIEYESYWNKPTKPSLVSTKATPAPTFSGPELQPFQIQFGLYGLTLGLFAGILLMGILWKLFP